MLAAEYALEFKVRSATQLLDSGEYEIIGFGAWEKAAKELAAKKKEIEKMRTK